MSRRPNSARRLAVKAAISMSVVHPDIRSDSGRRDPFSRRLGPILLILAAVLSACGSRPAASGEAILQDIINSIQVGADGGPLETARNGASVDVGTQVKSGENSLARLAYSAGPVVRLSSNTSFAMEAPKDPEEVRLRLDAGRLRLSLFGHRFGVSTPLGLIHLAGFADVTYHVGASPEAGDDALAFRCLSGPCLFQSDAADLALANLEALTVVDGGLTMTRTVLAELDLRQFIADNPGSTGLLATLTAAPTRTFTPAPDTPTPTRTATPPLFDPSLDTPLPSGAPATDTSSPSPQATATATRPPIRTAPPRPTSTSTSTDTDTPLPPTPTDTPPPSGGGGDEPPPPPPPPPTEPPPPPPTDTPVPPPTDTPLPPPPPTKTPGG